MLDEGERVRCHGRGSRRNRRHAFDEAHDPGDEGYQGQGNAFILQHGWRGPQGSWFRTWGRKLAAQAHYGKSTVAPVVARECRASWARRASASLKRWLTATLTAPDAITEKRSRAVSSSSWAVRA